MEPKSDTIARKENLARLKDAYQRSVGSTCEDCARNYIRALESELDECRIWTVTGL